MTEQEKQLIVDMKELTESVNNHVSNITTEKRIPGIELEILSSNIKALADKTLILRYLQMHVDSFIVNTATEEKEIEKEVMASLLTVEDIALVSGSEIVDVPTPTQEEALVTNVESVQREKATVVAEVIVESENEEIIIEEKPISTIEEEKEEITAPITESTTSVNERFIAHEAPASVSEKLQMTPIENLKSALSINQKYLITNELFNGNNPEFLAAIEHIETLGNTENALEYMIGLKNKFNWNLEEKTSLLFHEMVTRRFL